MEYTWAYIPVVEVRPAPPNSPPDVPSAEVPSPLAAPPSVLVLSPTTGGAPVEKISEDL